MFEKRFDRNFTDVRFHTDGDAACVASAINARAFTYRNHIAFASGEYQPASRSGQQLTAHELVHVLQQRQGSGLFRAPSKRNPFAGQRVEPDLDLAARRSDSASSAKLVLSVRSSLIDALTGFAEMQQFLLMLNGDELRNSTTNILVELLRNRIQIQSGLLELRAELNTLAGTIGQVTYVGSIDSLGALRTRFELVSESVVDLVANLQTVQGLIDVGERTNELLLLAHEAGGIFDSVKSCWEWWHR